MRYRKLSTGGDYVFGAGSQFLVDTPETVGQAVLTRMKLDAGEWFLDSREGLNLNLILGNNTISTRDLEMKRRILGTPGVTKITKYSSSVQGRGFSVMATIDTIYGETTITGVF